MRRIKFCAVLALAIAGAFAFAKPIHAEAGAFNDVWYQSDTEHHNCGFTNYPCNQKLLLLPTLAIHFVNSTSSALSSVDFTFSSDVQTSCAGMYTGGVPVLTKIYLENETESVYGSAPTTWTEWSDPSSFHSINFQLSSAMTATPTSTTLEVVCGTQNGTYVQYQATPPGNTAWRSYEYRADGPSLYPDLASDLLFHLDKLQSSSTLISVPRRSDWCNSTSTGGWINDIGAGVSNGICNAGFTLFVPSQNSIDTLISKKDYLLTKFPFSETLKIQNAITSSTSAASSTLSLSFDFAASSTIATGTPSIYPTGGFHIFSKELYEQWVPSAIRTLIYAMFRLGIWYGVAMMTYALAKRLLRKKEE